MSALKLLAVGATGFKSFLDEHVVAKGLFGAGAVFTGAGISLSQIEQWMRMGSLGLGMIVAALTIRSLWIKNSK